MRNPVWPEPRLGIPVEQLETPALVVDLAAMQQNIRAMVGFCTAHGVDWRPHAKCHKSRWIAESVVAAGAVGITSAKLSEAEMLASDLIPEILIANLIVGRWKLQRLAQLARRTKVLVCVDHADQLDALSAALVVEGATVRVLVELEVGMQRVGVPIGNPARELIYQILKMPGLEFAGLMAYEGHLLTLNDPACKRKQIVQALEPVVDFRWQLEAEGISCPIVSSGGTGSFAITAEIPGVTEIQAGGAILMDAFYREACHVESLPYALFIDATVVSTPTPTRAVIDAGRKTMDSSIHRPIVLDQGNTQVESLSAEHGILRVDPDHPLKIGHRVRIVPGYSDLTIQLHDRILGIRDGRLERIIQVDARGCVQ